MREVRLVEANLSLVRSNPTGEPMPCQGSGVSRVLMFLMNADYTFVNERLARHYGIPNI